MTGAAFFLDFEIEVQKALDGTNVRSSIAARGSVANDTEHIDSDNESGSNNNDGDSSSKNGANSSTNGSLRGSTAAFT